MSNDGTVQRTRFEGSTPILMVTHMAASVRYYVDVLGFREADWGTDDFTCVNRDRAAIYLCRGGQGQPETWVWIGVEDVEELHGEFVAKGVRIDLAPVDQTWGNREMYVKDADGNCIRFIQEGRG